MTTRIRYRNVNGFLVSKPVMAGTDLVTVTLDSTGVRPIASLTGADGTILANLNDDSLHYLKIQVKNVLRGMGALFNDEVRKTDRKTLTTSVSEVDSDDPSHESQEETTVA